ncbi:MAG: cysteine desulfurase [Gemmatimonadetes bacterium]|nr:cysteine desulfurase [Gemmatimonadota bacterium]
MTMKPIYLDYAATTPVRDEVREAMGPLLSDEFGNPSSRHRWGRAAMARLEEARDRSAAALGVTPREILFIRGGTESDNLAILGRAAVWSARGEEPLVVVSAIEHKAVLEAAESVTRSGGECVVVGVGRDGTLDEDALRTALERKPAIVSMMWVNNEVGVMLPVVEVAEMAHASGAVFHTDAVQAVGKVPVRLGDTEIDLATVTGHKIYGPKGTGLLVVRRGTEVAPRVFGGGQEHGLRPGTEDVAGAVGMSVAVELATREAEFEAKRLTIFRRQLEASLVAELGSITVHGAEAKRAPHILSIGIPQTDQEVMLAGLDLEGIAVSGGSACDSGAVVKSHVLLAMYGDDARGATVRFSFGHGTTADHIHAAAAATVAVVRRAEAAAAS